MNPYIARFISYALHPGFMPTISFGLLFAFAPDLFDIETSLRVSLQLLAIIFIGTFLFPALSLLILYHYRYVDSLALHDRKDRPMPLFITTLYLTMITYYFTYRLHLGGMATVIMLGIAVSSLISTVISLFYQISLHAMGAAGLLGALFGLQLAYPALGLFYVMIGCTLLTGLIASARLALNAHTPGEVFAGNAVGFAINCTLVLFVGYE